MFFSGSSFDVVTNYFQKVLDSERNNLLFFRKAFSIMPDGFEKVHGGYVYSIRNDEGKAILEFILTYDLVVANTYLNREILT